MVIIALEQRSYAAAHAQPGTPTWNHLQVLERNLEAAVGRQQLCVPLNQVCGGRRGRMWGELNCLFGAHTRRCQETALVWQHAGHNSSTAG